MGTRRASNIDRQIHNFAAFDGERRRKPFGSKVKLRKSDYGALSSTSRYRQQRTADTTLATTMMNAAQLLIEASRLLKHEEQMRTNREVRMEQIRKNSYAVPTDKGLPYK
jgi:hypothetical protein